MLLVHSVILPVVSVDVDPLTHPLEVHVCEEVSAIVLSEVYINIFKISELARKEATSEEKPEEQ